MKQSLAITALVSTASAIKTPDGSPIYVHEFHFNEDPHSVPNPIAGKPYLTATQAKYLKKETWDTDTEVKDIHPNYHGQHNWRATEPVATTDNWMTKYWGKEPLAVQVDNESDESDSESESDDEPENHQNVQWKQTADLGELDDHATLRRESDNDYLIGKAKFHGWTNPLGWTDDGNDDDLVLV